MLLWGKGRKSNHSCLAKLKSLQWQVVKMASTTATNLGLARTDNTADLGVCHVFTAGGQKFNLAYLGSDISPGTPPCSWNCWHFRSSRRKRNACTADCRCQRSSASPALDRDRELRLNGTGSCHLGKGRRRTTVRKHSIVALHYWFWCEINE